MRWITPWLLLAALSIFQPGNLCALGLGGVQLEGLAGKCLDVRGMNPGDGAEIILFECNGAPNQIWHLPPRGFTGMVRGLAGKCLDVYREDPSNGTRVDLFRCNGAPNQLWRLEPDGHLVGLAGKCLDVLGADPSNFAPIGIYDCNGAPNQLWQPRAKGRWLPIGPEGEADVNALVVDPNDSAIVYAATAGGLYRSIDGGASWAMTGNGLQGESLESITIDPNDSSTLYTSFPRQKSTDRGITWTPELFPGSRLLIDPSSSAVRYVALATSLHKSTDAGASWHRLDLPAELERHGFAIGELAIQPFQTSHLYLGISDDTSSSLPPGRGIFKSTDAGSSWFRLGPEVSVAAIEIDPRNPAVVYAASDSVESPGTFKSVDGGLSWSFTSLGSSSPLDHLALEPAQPAVLYASANRSLYKSTDGGASWFLVEDLEEYIRFVVPDPRIPGHLFVGTPSELLESTDGGASWQSSRRGFNNTRISSLAIAGESGSLLAVGRKLYRSTDQGAHWTEIPIDGESSNLLNVSLLVAPSEPSVVYAYSSYDEPQLLLKSTDSGASWTPRDVDPTGIDLIARTMAIDPTNSEIVYLGGRDETSDVHLLKSTDGGESWQGPGQPPDSFVIEELLVDPGDPRILYASTAWELHRSTDGGGTWSTVFGFSYADGLADLAFDPRDGTLYMQGVDLDGPRCELLRSSDHGTSWFVVERKSGDCIQNMLFPAARPGIIWATPKHRKPPIWSDDGGASWHTEAAGLTQGFFVPFDLVVDPRNPERVYFSSARGVWSGDFDTTASLFLKDRFDVSIRWRDFQGNTGVARPQLLTSDTGYFWFFDEDNVEIALKILDGRRLNGHYWVFYASLSNVEFEITIFDTLTGTEKTYFNPLGQFASFGDAGALSASTSLLTAAARLSSDSEEGAAALADLLQAMVRATRAENPPPAAAQGAEKAGPLRLNDDRFEVEVEWEDFMGHHGQGVPVELTEDTGYFWFFDDENVEVVVKVLDGRPINGRFWVFYGGLSNVRYTVTVRDTVTGAVRTYVSPLGQFGSVGDTEAF